MQRIALSVCWLLVLFFLSLIWQDAQPRVHAAVAAIQTSNPERLAAIAALIITLCKAGLLVPFWLIWRWQPVEHQASTSPVKEDLVAEPAAAAPPSQQPPQLHAVPEPSDPTGSPAYERPHQREQRSPSHVYHRCKRCKEHMRVPFGREAIFSCVFCGAPHFISEDGVVGSWEP